LDLGYLEKAYLKCNVGKCLARNILKFIECFEFCD
jgi:hypothetical protein